MAPRILVIEDSAPDRFLIRDALMQAGIGSGMNVVEDGEAAIRFFDQMDRDPSAACPDLVILDLNLPKRKGADVLRHMRASERCSRAKVLVVTSSDSARDREDMERLGSDGYFLKSSDYAEFMKLGPRVRTLLESEPRQ